jgi:hypothetical protein
VSRCSPSPCSTPARHCPFHRILDDAEFLERLQQGFVYLSNAGVPAPDAIGAELETDDDYRVAEALWEQARVVFLTAAQMECAASWQGAGFAVVAETENWWLAVEHALEERLKND